MKTLSKEDLKLTVCAFHMHIPVLYSQMSKLGLEKEEESEIKDHRES